MEILHNVLEPRAALILLEVSNRIKAVVSETKTGKWIFEMTQNLKEV